MSGPGRMRRVRRVRRVRRMHRMRRVREEEDGDDEEDGDEDAGRMVKCRFGVEGFGLSSGGGRGSAHP